MNIRLGIVDERYRSMSQRSGRATEAWVESQIYCPGCGGILIKHKNNKPVADFLCPSCGEDFELKSKKGPFGKRINDGAYRTMLRRLAEDSNPNLFLLNYSLSNWTVTDFFAIPKQFFTRSVIMPRNPLRVPAQRAGWQGCNILIDEIPYSGRVVYIKDGALKSKRSVQDAWQKAAIVRDIAAGETRGWTLDVLRCMERMGKREFTIQEAYQFESYLSALHPDNRHIKDKIRQQLQILRDKGFLEFSTRGNYKLA